MVKPGYKQTEVGVIPEDWEVVPVFDLAGRDKARFDDGDWVEARFLADQGIRLIQTGNIGIGRFIEKASRKYISDTSFEVLRCKEIRTGDLLICRLAEPAGRACILPVLEDQRAITAVDVTIMRPDTTQACAGFLLHVFGTSWWFRQVAERCGGSTRTRIARGSLAKIQLGVPRPEEQKVIAEALSDADALIESLEALIAKKRQIKQGAMQELLTGKRRLPGFSGEWETHCLVELAECLDNRRVPLNEVQRGAMRGEYPYCGANGILDHIDDYIFDEPLILIAEDGGHFEEFATRPIAYLMRGRFWVNNHAHVLRAREGVDQAFLFYSLVHKDIRPFLASGTRAKLNRGEMDKVTIRHPTLIEEQRAIAAVLSNLDAELEALETKVEKARAIKQGMMQELLTGRTRLVPAEVS